jgi:DNA-binding NtrC family response regulator
MPDLGKTADRYQMVGEGPAARRVVESVDALARRECTVLILGESGTGKELAARQIHARSRRSGGPFVPVDCTTLRDTLFESQLFGHVRGAFTGADRPTLGFFRAADRGVLFLDEVGELQPHVQSKLLRCIQDSAVVPLGGVTPVRASVRILCATHRDLGTMVAAGAFRQDLYYRLNVASLTLPPLRRRKEDVPLLVRHCLAELARLYQEPAKSVAPETLSVLCAYHWPGNVRELYNAMEHALAFSAAGEILPSDLPDAVRHVDDTSDDDDGRLLTMAAAERRLVARALLAFNGNQTRTAEALAIERHRLHRIVVRHGLEDLTRPRPR